MSIDTHKDFRKAITLVSHLFSNSRAFKICNIDCEMSDKI